MSHAQTLPEIRVTRKGPSINCVLFDPKVDGAPVFDFGAHVMKVESEIVPGFMPSVKVTFLARIVEDEE